MRIDSDKYARTRYANEIGWSPQAIEWNWNGDSRVGVGVGVGGGALPFQFGDALGALQRIRLEGAFREEVLQRNRMRPLLLC